jgi:hypothetical protein
MSFDSGLFAVFSRRYSELNTAYRNLMKNPKSVELSEIFFDAFPSTWMEFMMTYQYMWQKHVNKDGKWVRADENYDLTMCTLCGKHVDALLNIQPAIPDSIYCDKLISLSIGGRWDADIPYALQVVLKKIISDKPQAMFSRLSKQTRGFQLRFWQFYWSSLYANRSYDKDCEELKKKMAGRFPNEVKIMTTGFEYAWREMMYPVDFYPHKSNKNAKFNVRKSK